jgi:hypothetical protein
MINAGSLWHAWHGNQRRRVTPKGTLAHVEAMRVKLRRTVIPRIETLKYPIRLLFVGFSRGHDTRLLEPLAKTHFPNEISRLILVDVGSLFGAISYATSQRDAQAIQVAVKDLVLAINEINGRSGMTETLERDELGVLIDAVVRASGFSLPDDEDITAEWREW